MLRTSLSRPLRLRHFSSSSQAWNTRLHPFGEPPSGANSSSETPVEPQPSSVAQNADVPRTENKTEPPREPIELSPYDLTLVKQRIREWTDQAAITVRNRADDFTATTKTRFSQLGAQLNKVTGYDDIEALKREVVEQEARINAARQAARQAKTEYDEAVVRRSNSQKEVNDLLQRKSLWTDGDVGRFTTLVRQDHLFEQEETRAKATVNESEDAVEREFSQLMRSILARYHEEQVWSDKIRSASTYGQLAALGLNLLVFVMAIVIVEPWKRRRLAQTFERKIEELSVENANQLDVSMKEIGRQLAEQAAVLTQMTEEVSEQLKARPKEITEEVKSTVEFIQEVQQEARVFQQWELGAAASSAFVAGVITFMLFGR